MLASDELCGDIWTPVKLQNYLTYMFIRLLEEGKVIFVKAMSPEDKTRAEQRGLPQQLCVFDTGLWDREDRNIYLVAVADSRGSFTALKTGLFRAGSDVDVFLREVLGQRSTVHSGWASYPPPHAVFFEPSDPSLVYDWRVPLAKNYRHIIIERVRRFIDAGVVDLDELNCSTGDDVADEAARLEVKARFWCDANGWDVYWSKPLAHGPHAGLKLLKLLKPKVYKDVKEYIFRRTALGKAALSFLLDTWVDQSIRVVRKTYSLAVPQFYYSKNADGHFKGTLQLLLPLYCGLDRPVLALSIQSIVGPTGVREYLATTVLTLDMAFGNARLLTTPQVSWVRA